MPATPPPATVERLGDRTWFARSKLANWALVRTAEGVVLIDAGYAEQADDVLESVRLVATADGAELPSAPVAILVTHAHTDHIGAIPAILQRYPGTLVLARDNEAAAVRGPEREQITIARMGLNLLRPRFVSWLRAGVGAGGLRETVVPNARAFTTDELATFGVRAHATPGHTVGSTTYEILGDDILVTGDAFITDHPTYPRPRAGAIDAHFSADDALARQTAAAISRSMTILPGHGPALRHTGTSP